MGLSRRRFTKEFKLAAVQRLEMGASLAEVARAFEVNPNVVHWFTAGGGSSAKDPAMPFPAWGSGAGTRVRWRNWSARLASRRWRSIS